MAPLVLRLPPLMIARPRRRSRGGGYPSPALRKAGVRARTPSTYGVAPMPERDVNSPVNTRNTTSKLGSTLPPSPAARSAPSRRDQTEAPSVQQEPQRRDRVATHQEPPIPSSTPVVVGP